MTLRFTLRKSIELSTLTRCCSKPNRGGVFEGATLQGFIALLPGWIDHLYVEPALHRRGIGSALVLLAETRQAELRLYTFQPNITARALYERHDFVIEELTDGGRNEEKIPFPLASCVRVAAPYVACWLRPLGVSVCDRARCHRARGRASELAVARAHGGPDPRHADVGWWAADDARGIARALRQYRDRRLDRYYSS